MLTPLGPSRSSWSLHRTRLEPLMLTLSPAGTPDRPLCRPTRCLLSHAPRGAHEGGWPPSQGPCFGSPVKARRARAREHLPSCRRAASRGSQTGQARTFGWALFRSTVSPSLGSCSASGGASSFPPASDSLVPPRSLATLRRARRAMRSTDFCHLNDLRAPVLGSFPAASAAFTAWMPPSCEAAACAAGGVLGSVRRTGVPSVSRHSRTLRRITARHALPCGLELSLTSWGGRERERGRYLPTAPAAIMPLTPLSPLPLARKYDGAFALPCSGRAELSRAVCAALSAWGSRQDRRDQRLVKARGSWQSEVPSTDKDPS